MAAVDEVIVRPVIRVLVVDDDWLVRSGLVMILGGPPDIEVVGEAADGQEAIDAARRNRPDVVLMDIRMPRLDGSVHRGLRAEDPPKVIVLTTFDTDDDIARALGAGASGFLLKHTKPPEIIDAIRKVADGDPMLSPSVTTSLIAQIGAGTGPERLRAAQDRLARLTEREHDVALAVAEGLSNAEIATRLYLSVATVKAHVHRLFTKLEVNNRVQVAICVHDAGLV